MEKSSSNREYRLDSVVLSATVTWEIIVQHRSPPSPEVNWKEALSGLGQHSRAGSWQPRGVRRGASLVEGVGVRPDHHYHLLERVGASSELSPVDSILVAAPVVAPAVPDPVEVGVGTGIIPPAALLVVGTVAYRRERARRSQGGGSTRVHRLLGGLLRDPLRRHLDQGCLRGDGASDLPAD